MTVSPTCPVCGRGLAAGRRRCPNRWCQRADRGFSVVFSLGRHDAGLRTAINRYKYGGERRMGSVFAGMLSSYLARHWTWFEEIDVVAAVPAYTGPGARRAWDPAGEILAGAATRIGPAWPVDLGLVVKTADTPRLAGRAWGGRQTVARGPLRRSLALGAGRDVAGARVLVFDDVMTEGSTMREVARLLRRAGAADVVGLVLARPGWGPDR